jgi:hypothetical protein
MNTAAYGINAPGSVTGFYEDSSGIEHGFVRTSNGTITSFDVSGSTGTSGIGINTAGAITGFYEDDNLQYGFVRAPSGTIVTFTVGSYGTIGASKNDLGSVAGSCGGRSFIRIP